MTDSATLHRCLTFVETQVGPARANRRHTPPPTITLSRLTGAGAIPVAERLAARLQEIRPGTPAPWTVFHRSLVEKMLSEQHLPGSFARYIPEDRVSYIQDTLEELLGLHPSSTSLVTQVTETILRLAEMGNCILVGRGANVILARTPTAFHVRLVSALPKRIERVMEARKVTSDDAADFIRKQDTARARYLKTNFDAAIDDPLAYHLTVNTDWFDLNDAAELIAQAVLLHFPVTQRGEK